MRKKRTHNSTHEIRNRPHKNFSANM